MSKTVFATSVLATSLLAMSVPPTPAPKSSVLATRELELFGHAHVHLQRPVREGSPWEAVNALTLERVPLPALGSGWCLERDEDGFGEIMCEATDEARLVEDVRAPTVCLDISTKEVIVDKTVKGCLRVARLADV